MSICKASALSSEITFLGHQCAGVTGVTIPGYMPTGPATASAATSTKGSAGGANRMPLPTRLADGVALAAIGMLGVLF
jgi:hypothetical protein